MREAIHTMNMNKYFKSTPNRYSEFAEFIDKSAVKELELFFPKLVSEIFNSDSKVNWGLRTRKADTNYAEFNEIFNFLQPNGPMFRLCYKLSLDCHFRHEFPYQCLPEVAREKLDDSGDTSLYKQKTVARSKTARNYISLNSFEYYLFHFAYHLVDPALQLPDENLLEWDTAYLRLVEAYLDHFVPCTHSLVYPILNQSSSPVTPSEPSTTPYLNTSKTSSIFREEVWKKISPSPPFFTRTKSSSSAEIWRTELVATLFLDFWLSSINESSKHTLPFTRQKLWTTESLPSKERLRCVRVLLRHLQYFSNHLLREDCAMNDLKKEILPNNRRIIYNFFYKAMTELPLDSSYRLLLEGWFTYIQPWRYTNPYNKNLKLKQSVAEGIDRRWFSFIAENLMLYTRLYYLVLIRLSRCDLTTYKISSMSYRLMQVFSQPQLLDYITEAEKYLEDGRLGNINTWNSIIRQNIYCLEKPSFHYDFFYSQAQTHRVMEFIKQIEENLPVLQLRKQQLQTNDDISFVKWMKEQLSGDVRYSSTEELERIEYYLTQSLQKLYQVHKIPNDDLSKSSLILNHTRGNTSFSFNSVSGHESTDGSFSMLSVRADPKERKKAALSLTYEGDPDLYPIRSWESKFLVRVLYYVCLWINTQFQRDLKRLYYEDNIVGGICRQIMYPPQRTYHYEKRASPDGYSRRVSNVLPPRISLRWCASYYFTFLCLLCYLLLKFFQYSVSNFFILMIFFYFLYLIMNSVLFPVPIEEHEADVALR